MDDLITKLKVEVIESLNLEDFDPKDLDADEPLFGEGLGLDSIDALELIVLLEKNYGLRVKDEETGKKVLYSLRTLAEFITENQKVS